MDMDTNSSNIIYIFNFTFNYGGIGDFIKYIMYFIHLYIGKKILIKSDHPIYKFIKFKNISLDYHYKDNKLNEYDKIVMLEPKNFWDKYNKDTEYKYKKIPFYDFFYFSDEIYSKVKELKHSLNATDKYNAIHLRFGDKFLENNNRTWMGCVDDNRIGEKSYDYYISLIKKIMSDTNTNTECFFFFSDNSNIKKLCKKSLPNLIINDFNIIHTGHQYTDINNSDYDKQLILTLSEYVLLSNANIIHVLSYSGFPIIAYNMSLLNNKLIKHYDLTSLD